MSVNIKYKGGTIAEITESVTKTLKTSGKYCEADIVVENTKDGGGISPVIQIPTYSAKDSGTITFASTTKTAQTITHNLGVVPDFIIIYAASGHTCKGNEMCFAYRLFKNVEIGSGTFFDTMRFKIARTGAGHGFGVDGRSIFEPELYVNKEDYYIGGSPTANTFIFYLTESYFAPAGTTYKWEVYKL